MAAITWDDVTSLPGADGLSVVSPLGQMTILVYVNNSAIDPDEFDGEDGGMTKYARCLIAAHMAQSGIDTAVENDGEDDEAAGYVASETEGDLTISYSSSVADMPIGTLPSNAAYWSRTEFGRAYWQLLQGSLARVGWVL